MGACCSGGGVAEINKTAVDLTHFDLLKVVGKGGFGKVNAVEHRLTSQLYALKTIEKALLLKNDSNRSTVWMEREVMARFRSHFLVHLKYAFQDKSFLYLVMNFMKGGDLRFHLDNHGPLNEDHTRFYMAEMLLGLQEMNSLGIVYRDLKPENVLLDEGGHLRISDFGLCSQLKAERGWMTYGESGTPGYLAPEVLTKQKYNQSQDVWSFGIVLFEFLHNHLPFDVNNRDEVISGDFRVKSSLTPEVKDLLKGLLTKDPNKRLGMGPSKWEDVKSHPWFRSIDWKMADELRLTPPFQPDPDVANCSSVFDLEDQLLYVHKDIEFSPADQKKFEGFEYHTAVTSEEIAAMIKAKKEGKTPGTPATPGTSSGKANANHQTPSNRNAQSDKNMNPNSGGPIPGKVKVMLKENMVPAGTVGATNGAGGPNGPNNANGNAANGVDSKRTREHRHEEKHAHGGTHSDKHSHPPLNGTTVVGSGSGATAATAAQPASTTPAAVPGLGAAIASVSTSAVPDSTTPSPSTQTLAVKSGIPNGGKKVDGSGGPLFVHTVPVNGNGTGGSDSNRVTAPAAAAAAALATPSENKPIIDEKLIPLATTATSPSITGGYGTPIPNGGIGSAHSTGSGGGDANALAAALTAAGGPGSGAGIRNSGSAGGTGAGDPNAVNGNPNASTTAAQQPITINSQQQQLIQPVAAAGAAPGTAQ